MGLSAIVDSPILLSPALSIGLARPGIAFDLREPGLGNCDRTLATSSVRCTGARALQDPG